MASPFERQPGEGAKAFAAFKAYLALGTGRTLAKTADVLGKTKSRLGQWSWRWHWQERVAAYDAHMGQVERESTEALVREKGRDWAEMHEGIRQQAWKEGEDLIALAQEFKARWRDSERVPDFGSVIRGLDLGFKLKQFAAGMPSEIKAVNTTVTGKLDVDWEIALKKIYGSGSAEAAIEVEAQATAEDAERGSTGANGGNGGPGET